RPGSTLRSQHHERRTRVANAAYLASHATDVGKPATARGRGPCDAWSFVRIRRTKCVRPTLAFLYARLGARYSLTAASSTVSTASGDASSRSLGIALPLLSDSP